MPVVSSNHAIDAHAQANGSHYVTETFTSSDGRVIAQQYLLPAGLGAIEAQVLLDAREAGLNTLLAQQEAESVIDGA